MNPFKSHLRFTKAQQSGIFLLAIIILALLVGKFFVLPKYQKNQPDFVNYNDPEIKTFLKELDSLKALKAKESAPKIYSFNPNYITDYKGYTLGMSPEEIDRLQTFRATNQWVNSADEFQRVTKISDSLLNAISPYFKFPDWVTNPKPNTFEKYNNKPKTFSQKIDLNTASASQLRRVNGVGEKLSERIIQYRNKFEGGFIADAQLIDVYGLKPEVIERIKAQFTVKTPRKIERFNLNTATISQLVTIEHIDYEIAQNIIEERTLREGFSSLDDLTKVKDFPVSKIEVVKLYLYLK
jgi:competence protein ComEA